MEYLHNTDVLELLVGDYGILNQPTIRPLQHLNELRVVYQMTHEAYVKAGYFSEDASRLLIHYPYFDHIPETTIFVALLHGKIAGSVSVTLDGINGFTVDEDFKSECEAIRLEGKPTATVWRLVVEDSLRTRRTIVLSLINEVVQWLLKAKVSTALFSVNPKHVNVYKRMLNMEVVAEKTNTEGLNNAPSVLLRGDPLKIPREPSLALNRDYNPLHFLLSNSRY